jgi:hypothetical protein
MPLVALRFADGGKNILTRPASVRIVYITYTTKRLCGIRGVSEQGDGASWRIGSGRSCDRSFHRRGRSHPCGSDAPLFRSHEVAETRIVNDLRLYADLLADPKRGEEQAAFLRETRLEY